MDSGPEGLSQSVRWLSKEDIEDRPLWNDADDGVGLAGMAGSGQCVGGVVSDTISTTSEVDVPKLSYYLIIYLFIYLIDCLIYLFDYFFFYLIISLIIYLYNYFSYVFI